MNAITTLLETAVEDGSDLTKDEIDVIIRRGARAERATVAKAIARAAREVRLLGQGKLDVHDDDVDGAIREIIADVAEKHARFVEHDPAVSNATAARDVEAITRAGREGGSATVEARRAKAKADREGARPLREVLEGIADGASLRDGDLDALDLDPGVDEAARTRFRGDVVRAAKRIADLRRGGAFGDARGRAQQSAAELGGALAAPRRVDPLENVDDPRELAAAISSRSAGRG